MPRRILYMFQLKVSSSTENDKIFKHPHANQNAGRFSSVPLKVIIICHFVQKQFWTQKGTGPGCALSIQPALIPRKKMYAETTLNPRACHDHNESSQRKHTSKVTMNHHSTKIPPIHMTTWKSHRAVDALVILSTSFNTCWFRPVLIWTQPRGWQTQSTDQNVSPLL